MTHLMMAKSKAAFALTAFLGGAMALPSTVFAQDFPVTATQRTTAVQVANAGIPLADVSPNAPDEYTVKRGDTLWAISGLFLKQPWRWPELWGMNLQDIKNPHLIYPGQKLYLERMNGRASLRTRQSANGEIPTETIRLSPRTRYESLARDALPTLNSQFIEPFLAEPVIVE